MREVRLRLLLVYADYTDRLSYYDDWFDAFSACPAFATDSFNIVTAGREDELKRKLAASDGIVLLHSTNGDTTVYLDRYAPLLADRKIPLLSFVGNEVNLPGSPIAAKRATFAVIRPEWIATQLLQEAGDFLFGDLTSRGVVAIPHALNPDVYRGNKPPEARSIDIGTRVARYLPHLGDDDRNRIVDFFSDNGADLGLTIDISNARFDRDGWVGFLGDCKGTVATEAGSWFIERDDATVNAIRDHVRSRTGGIFIANDSALRTIGHKLPWWLRAALRKVLRSGLVRHEALVNERISYQDIFELFFAGRLRPAIHGKCISSRHFDAIGTRTCQIMFRGRFNDILEADKHYIALADDFSNIGDVLARFRDTRYRTDITAKAYEHILDGHTYAHRMRQVAGLFGV
jgi:hypothetical protein